MVTFLNVVAIVGAVLGAAIVLLYLFGPWR